MDLILFRPTQHKLGCSLHFELKQIMWAEVCPEITHTGAEFLMDAEITDTHTLKLLTGSEIMQKCLICAEIPAWF